MDHGNQALTFHREQGALGGSGSQSGAAEPRSNEVLNAEDGETVGEKRAGDRLGPSFLMCGQKDALLSTTVGSK